MSCVTADAFSVGDSDSDDSVGFSFPYFFDDIPDDPMARNYAAINIQSHVPIKLELRSPNYTKWKAFFEALCGKFGLLSHIDGTPPPDPRTDEWSKADFCVRSWTYGSVADEVLDFTMEPDQTANGLWKAIADHFQANQAPRAIFLSQAFHSMTQGDRKIEDYGNEMKKAADALRNVGQAVSPSTLLLNLLRGLNSRYSTTADIIAGTAGMTFATALDQLKLKELRLESEAKVEATNALVASSSSGYSGANYRPSSHPQQPLPPQQQQQQQQGAGGSSGGQQQQPSNGGQRRKRNNGRRSNGGGSGQQQQPRAPFPAGPWICINPQAFQGAQGFGGGLDGFV
jgi:hypothetical protein